MRDRKQEERTRVMSLVGGMSPEDRRLAEAGIAGRLASVSGLCQAQSVMLYVSAGHEVGTHSIIRSLLDAGKTVSVPRCIPKTRDLEAVVIRDMDRDLEPGYAGIAEPGRGNAEKLAEYEIGAVAVPLVAFSPDCSRLGRGKGFYDRFLRKLAPGCIKVGLAFESQKSPGLPVEGHDVRLDMIVTEKCVYVRP